MDTISAIATPTGIGAVGIVRISGDGARDVFRRVWTSSTHFVDNFVTHRFYYGIVHSSTGINVDNVLAVWMQAPHSFTGEDVIEIHCHGGSHPAKLVLEATLSAGARLAEPGEFTKRAFLNKKMDLAQAEAVADIIGATSSKAYRLAREQLEGRLSSLVKNFLTDLKGLKAFVEATIDFPEEDVEFIGNEKISQKISELLPKIEDLSLTYNEGRLVSEGVKVALAGRPNVGKSSILNALSGREKAIVHHTPGTTRDIVDENVELGGILFHLTDTAGIRDSSCEIENIGISRAKEKMANADILVLVVTADEGMTKEDEDIIKNAVAPKKFVVYNKLDLVTTPRKKDVLYVSAKTLEGINELKDKLVNIVGAEAPRGTEGAVITNLRHKSAIDNSIEHLKLAKTSIQNKESAEFVAFHLQNTMNELGKITGEVTTEEVLNEIFSKFCIGK